MFNFSANQTHFYMKYFSEFIRRATPKWPLEKQILVSADA